MMVALVIMAVVVGMFIGVHTLISGATMVVAMRVPSGMVMVAAMPVFDECEFRRWLGPVGAGCRGLNGVRLRRIAGSEVVRSLRVVRHRRSIPY
jgi:hypothetical protein